MKFTEEKLERAFTELLGQEGFPHHLGITISRKSNDQWFVKKSALPI
jgi:type I restriction enzyme R subunit